MGENKVRMKQNFIYAGTLLDSNMNLTIVLKRCAKDENESAISIQYRT